MSSETEPAPLLNNRRTIRKKLLVSTVVLGILLLFLGASGIHGVYSYRDLATALSHRAMEMPLTNDLATKVRDLRDAFRQLHSDQPASHDVFAPRDQWALRGDYALALLSTKDILQRYNSRLQLNGDSSPYLSDNSEEKSLVRSIERRLMIISNREHADSHLSDPMLAAIQAKELDELYDEVNLLPTLLQHRMASFRAQVRSQYRLQISLMWFFLAIAGALVAGLIVYARVAVIRPFKKLLSEARLVASGVFDHRIEIESQDEIAELASVINRGTDKFLRIQSDLNEEVMKRSREVIRNEQLASVGFLAAGVAHEINNPLASIAWSAEALEARLHKILHPIVVHTGEELPELETLKTYLRRIQDEAFRCKGITERLLDFSRLSQVERKQPTDMILVVEDVIELVKHLGQYRNRKIEFKHSDQVNAWASPQEMKQVVLNLLTNSLDASLEDRSDQMVLINLHSGPQWVHLTIEDNGCGMTDEVREHLFEPFFTRRRDGRGTGLGLPITSRIIADHGGSIIASSRGVNLGSKFEVLIPTESAHRENESEQQKSLTVAA